MAAIIQTVSQMVSGISTWPAILQLCSYNHLTMWAVCILCMQCILICWSWSLGIYASLVHHPSATLNAISATGCVVHGSGFLPTTSPTRDDETRHVDGSVHDPNLCILFHAKPVGFFFDMR